MRFKFDPEKGLMVWNPVVRYPLSSDFARELINLGLRESGTLLPVHEHHGVQHISVEWRSGIWYEVDNFGGRLVG